MTFEEVRAQFPVLERVAYLNAGTFGPLARPTVEAMAREDRAELEQGRGGTTFFEGYLARRERVREKLAAYLHVGPGAVALTASTTDGCNVVLGGLRLGPHDEVVTTDVEHFGLLGPLHASAARVRVAGVGDLPAERALDAILAEVGPRTRLLALSQVAWTTGNRLPLRELREATGVPILVDGAQSVGAIPVDGAAFDYLTVSAQKWLCGPAATGALVVRDPDSLAVAAPSHFSKEGDHGPDGTFVPRAGAPRFDTGWLPGAALAGLEAALDLAPEWRYSHAAEAAADCRALLESRFRVVTEPGQGTLVSFEIEEDAEAAAARLHEAGVVVRNVPNRNWLRASCGYWTSREDVDRLAAALG